MNGTKQAGIKASYARKNLKIGEKRVMIVREKSKDEEEGDEINIVELFKKRILVGKKCMPLNVSGELHYDEEESY